MNTLQAMKSGDFYTVTQIAQKINDDYNFDCWERIKRELENYMDMGVVSCRVSSQSKHYKLLVSPSVLRGL